MIDFDAVLEDTVAYPEVLETVSSVPSVNPLDLRIARAKIAEYDSAIDGMVAKAKKHVVTDEPTNTQAVAMAGQAKALAAKIEKVRKTLVEEPNQYVKKVNTLAKTYITRLASIEYDLKAKINAFQIQQQRMRIEMRRKVEEESRKLQEQVQKDAAESGIQTPIEIPAPIIPPAETVTRTENGTASLRKVWKWALRDFAAVPDQFKMLNEKEINMAVKAGARNIPGLEIYEETQTVIRSATISDNEKF